MKPSDGKKPNIPTSVERWIRRGLYVATLATAAVLIVAVLTAPWFASPRAEEGWPRLLALFGYDAVVRRTCLAAAAGLAVTAFVFFQPGNG